MKEGDKGKFVEDIWWVGEHESGSNDYYIGWHNEQELQRIRQKIGNDRLGTTDPEIKAGAEYTIHKYEPDLENAGPGYVYVEMLEKPNALYSSEPTRWWFNLHDFSRFTDVSSSGRARRALRGLR